MKHYLQYNKTGSAGVLELEPNSVTYLDLTAERPALYKKPLEAGGPIVLCGKSTVFIVDRQQAVLLKTDTPCVVQDVEFRLKAADYALLPLYQKYKPIALDFFKARRNRPYLLAALAVLLVVAIFAQYGEDAPSDRSAFDSNIHQLQPDLTGNNLVEMRLKHAKQAFAEKKYTLTIELLDKVLTINPNEPQALELRELALQNENADKQGQKQSLKKDIRTKTLMDTALNLVTRKDYDGALLQLEQILGDNPDDADALKLYASIQDNIKKADEERQNQNALQNQAIQESQNLWKQGEASLKAQDYAAAWPQLARAMDLLEQTKADTFFKSDLKASLNLVETELHNQTLPIVQQAKSQQADGDRQSGLKQITAYKNSLTGYLTAQQKFSKFPFLDNEIGIVIKKLNEALKPLYTEAQVTEDLEGCCPAQPYYSKVMQHAAFEAVPYYKKAKEAIAQCSCR